MEAEAARAIGAAITALSLFGVGLAMGNIASTLISSVARNPAARDTVFPIGLLGLALTEAIALFALVIAFLILFG